MRAVGGTQYSPGVRHLDLLDPHGRSVRVPAAWTDLGLPDEQAVGISTKSRVSARVLDALVGLVEAIEGKKVDEDLRAANMRRPEQMVSHVDDDSKAKAGHLVDGHSSGAAKPRAQHARNRRAATTTKRGDGERGSR